jgi:hypothetical protein
MVEKGKIGPSVWQATGGPGYPSIANLTGLRPLPLFGSPEWDGGPPDGSIFGRFFHLLVGSDSTVASRLTAVGRA